MIKESTIESNMELYVKKMEAKLAEDQRKIDELRTKINNAAGKIQKQFRKYWFYKITMAARKLQKFWRKTFKKLTFQRQILHRVKVMFNAYKILYFFKSIQGKGSKTDKKQRNRNKKPIIKRRLPTKISSNIRISCPKYMILLSSLEAELAYIKKYAAFDRKSFTEQWETHQKKQSEWIWAQIKKKWVKKDGSIWINDSQKEVNAEKYVSHLIEQTYLKEYERFEQSQLRLKENCEKMKVRITAIRHTYYLALTQ